jgi:phosphohistidine phosphatase
MTKPAKRLLLILRHAKASRDLPVLDCERALTESGLTDTDLVAAEARRLGFIPDLLLCSPARRARETAERFCKAAGPAPQTEIVPELYPGDDAQELLKLLRRTPPAARRVMLVGHNPGFEELARYLAGDSFPHDHVPTGALVCFEVTAPGWDRVDRDTVRCLDLLRPKALGGGGDT